MFKQRVKHAKIVVNTEQKNKHLQPIAMHKYEAQLAVIIYKWGAHTTKNSGNEKFAINYIINITAGNINTKVLC